MNTLVAPFAFGQGPVWIAWIPPRHACGIPAVISYTEDDAPFVKVDFGGL